MNYKKMYLELADIILADSIDRTPRNVKTLAYEARQALNEFEIHRSIINDSPTFDMEAELIAMNRYYNGGLSNG